jgi:hypothetical protein
MFNVADMKTNILDTILNQAFNLSTPLHLCVYDLELFTQYTFIRYICHLQVFLFFIFVKD